VGKIAETPKPGSSEVRSSFHLLATNRTAVQAAKTRADQLGYAPHVIPSPLEGEARMVGETLARRLVGEGASLIGGGESTVRLRSERRGGPGLGGRCQELALATALHLRDVPASICAFATDGVDGPTDAAGAFVDGRTLARGLEKKRDPRQHIEDNDAYTFFASLGDLVRTGSTGTNVMDLFVGLVAR
jgi:glycerate-2-kinase